MYPKNAWYVACTPDEIAEQPLGRRVCGQPIVFYRPAPDRVAALEDFCPHRGAPLSLGRVCDGNLIDVRLPRHAGGVRRSGAVDARSAGAGFCAHAQLCGDRAPRLHLGLAGRCRAGRPRQDGASALGRQPRVGLWWRPLPHRLRLSADDRQSDGLDARDLCACRQHRAKGDRRGACKTRVAGAEVITSRFMPGIQAPPFWKMALRMNGLPDDLPMDRWQICHFTPPSHVLIEVGVALAGFGGHEAAADKKVACIVVNFITPETETSIHYFWGMARHFKPQDPALTARIREGQGKIFAEDRQMLEMQQQNLLRYPERKLLTLNIDAGGVQSRRVIERVMAAELGA